MFSTTADDLASPYRVLWSAFLRSVASENSVSESGEITELFTHCIDQSGSNELHEDLDCGR